MGWLAMVIHSFVVKREDNRKVKGEPIDKMGIFINLHERDGRNA